MFEFGDFSSSFNFDGDMGGDGVFAPAFDMGGTGVLAPSVQVLPSNPFFDLPWSTTPSLAPSGMTNIANTTNNSTFWGFDQSRISSSIQDVLGSVVQAGAKSGVQFAADSINSNRNNANPSISRFFNNFASTKTGSRVQAGSMAFSAQNFLMNPMVWLGVVGVFVVWLFMRK